MGSIFDLHVHTNEGCMDSALAPEEFIEEAHRLELNGAVLAEYAGWQGNRFLDYNNNREDDGIILIHALEVYTTMGHVILKKKLPVLLIIQQLLLGIKLTAKVR